MENMVMSRSSRLVMNELNKLAKDSNVQGLTIPAHVYMCDYMTIKYSHRAIVNIIRSKLASIAPSRRQSKHYTVAYWYSVIDSMLKDNPNAKMDVGDATIYGDMQDYNSFNHLTRHYLKSDYSNQDALTINNIVNTTDFITIVNACKVAERNCVFNMQYLRTIIDGEKQRAEYEALKTRLVNEKATESSNRLRMDIHTHTPLELAKIEYDYNQKRNDILLELMLKNLLEGGAKK